MYTAAHIKSLVDDVLSVVRSANAIKMSGEVRHPNVSGVSSPNVEMVESGLAAVDVSALNALAEAALKLRDQPPSLYVGHTHGGKGDDRFIFSIPADQAFTREDFLAYLAEHDYRHKDISLEKVDLNTVVTVVSPTTLQTKNEPCVPLFISNLGQREGWDIFEEDGSFSLQRNDNDDSGGFCRFASDGEAWLWVMEQAQKGSVEHQDALEFLFVHAPVAHQEILEFCESKIPAVVYSDDKSYEVNFNAAAWFNQASDEGILALASIGWGGDYAADTVAEFFMKKNPEIDVLLDYCHHKTNTGENMGFECHVDEVAALDWLRRYKYELGKQIVSSNMENFWSKSASPTI